MMNNLAGIGKKGRLKLAKVLATNPGVITSSVVSKVLGQSSSESSRLLSRWAKNGWVSRIKQGAYVPVSLDSTSNDMALYEPFLVADSIFQPGYIGGFSAIKYWDLSEQIIETVYYFTTKKVQNRSPTIGSTRFKIKTVKKDKIFGTKNIWFGSKKVLISDPTKTIVDLLDDPKLVGGMTIVWDIYREYKDSEYFDPNLLTDYIYRIGNRTAMKRLGYMLETMRCDPPPDLSKIVKDISSGYSFFDPMIKDTVIAEKWKLKVPPSWKDLHDRKK